MLDLKQYKQILESSPNMVWRSGLDTKCNYFNKTWLDFTGKTMQQEVGDGWTEGVHPDDFDGCVKTYLDSFSMRVPFEMNYRLMRYDGVYRIINDRGIPFFDDSGSFAGYIGSCIDVTEKIEGEMLRETAIKDGLTDVFNRQYVIASLEKELEAARLTDSCLTLLMIDLDKLKDINDNHGHLAGDKSIIAVANTIRESIRGKDLVGRFGGDEFIVLLSNTNLDSAKVIAGRIRERVHSLAMKSNGDSFSISASIGISVMSCDTTPAKLIDTADKAMYESKARGGNCVSFYEKVMDTQLL